MGRTEPIQAILMDPICAHPIPCDGGATSYKLRRMGSGGYTAWMASIDGWIQGPSRATYRAIICCCSSAWVRPKLSLPHPIDTIHTIPIPQRTDRQVCRYLRESAPGKL